MKNKARKDLFDKKKITFLGRLSFYLSIRKIVHGLKRGNWLDILSGYNSELQRTQIHNPIISSFTSLDHKLNKNLKKNNISIKEATLHKKLPIKSNKFKNVTMVNGLEHLWYPQKILTECFRVMKPKGVLQIIVPTWFGKTPLEFFAFKLKNTQGIIEMNDHKMYYDEKTLWPMLVKAGFKPRNIHLKRIKFFCSLYAMAVKD